MLLCVRLVSCHTRIWFWKLLIILISLKIKLGEFLSLLWNIFKQTIIQHSWKLYVWALTYYLFAPLWHDVIQLSWFLTAGNIFTHSCTLTLVCILVSCRLAFHAETLSWFRFFLYQDFLIFYWIYFFTWKKQTSIICFLRVHLEQEKHKQFSGFLVLYCMQLQLACILSEYNFISHCLRLSCYYLWFRLFIIFCAGVK